MEADMGAGQGHSYLMFGAAIVGIQSLVEACVMRCSKSYLGDKVQVKPSREREAEKHAELLW